jgi:predicted transposase/invertase (TIGR01784 family)
MLRLLNPQNDLVFKRLFGTETNKEFLIQFLNDVLKGAQKTVRDVTFLPTHQDPEIASLRQSIVDVLCHDTKGNRFIIEMQCSSDTSFIQRAIAYACRAYLDQKRKKVSYSDIKPVIFFAVVNKSLFKKKKAYLSHHKVTDVCTGENDIKQLSFSFLELEKFTKQSIGELKTNIERWAYFFKNAQEMSEEEFAKLEHSNKKFWEVYKALDEYNYSSEELLEYERYEMKRDEIMTSLSDAKEEGKAEGKAEGLAEGKAEGLAEGKAEGLAEGEALGRKKSALLMLAAGLPVETISQCTDLSIQEIEALQH